MRQLRQVTAFGLTALLLVACGNGDADRDADASGCRDAVAKAAEATNVDNANLEPVFTACQDLAEFGAAIQESPEILKDVGADVQGWAEEQCRKSETLRDTPLCDTLG